MGVGRSFLRQRLSVILLAGTLWAGPYLGADGIDVPALAQMLQEENSPKLIDIRSNRHFRDSHIPGAMNVPVPVLKEKRLPPLGEVVVYGDGLGRNDIGHAVSLLNAKRGIEAVPLEGGYAAWQSRSHYTSGATGLKNRPIPRITYQQLKEAKKADMILVDLRREGPSGNGRAKASAVSSASTAKESTNDKLTDLEESFPDVPVVRRPFAISERARLSATAELSPESSLLKREATPTDSLLVLIDRNNGEADKTARRLQANGWRRVVVLSGGETVIKYRGQSGLKRHGSTLGTYPSKPE